MPKSRLISNYFNSLWVCGFKYTTPYARRPRIKYKQAETKVAKSQSRTRPRENIARRARGEGLEVDAPPSLGPAAVLTMSRN